VKEKISTPFKYVGEVSRSCLVPLKDIQPESLQQMSQEALNSYATFRNFKEKKQNNAIQALSLMGAYTISNCNGKWNRTRWLEQWGVIKKQAQVILQKGSRNTSKATMETGYQVLFNMLEAGVKTRKDLLEYRKKLKNVDKTQGRVTHTFQMPTSRPTHFS